MAHFARVDSTGIVREVVVVDNVQLLNATGQESEAVGQAYLARIGLAGTWVQTSYSGSMRGQFAGIGMLWDGVEFVTAPSALTTSRDTIPADGTTAATLTYRNRGASAPASVVFTVNGATQTVALTDGLAQLDITTSTAGSIDVTVDALPDTTVTITATAVA